MTKIHVIAGKVKSGKSTESIREALLLQKATGLTNGRPTKAVVVVTSETHLGSEKYLAMFEEVTGMDFNPKVWGLNSIEQGISVVSKDNNLESIKDGILVLEDFDLLNRFRDNKEITEEELNFISLFDHVIIPSQVGLDGLIQYDQKGLIEYIADRCEVTKTVYTMVKMDLELGKTVIYDTYEILPRTV